MNRDILDSFNEVVKNPLVCHIFKNYSGKNKWSIICSASEWISVVLEGITTENLVKENNNQASIKMITFISCVDILNEAVQQLHRVLFDTNEIPFKDDYSIFNANETDNMYFKTIRACFAAHPINLKADLNGDKRYASWSGATIGEGDFSVFLYSNNPLKSPIPVIINFDELYTFALTRYKYLLTLKQKLEIIIERYKEKYREIIIPATQNINDRIDILNKENELRLEDPEYDYQLKKLKIVFSFYCTNDNNQSVIEKYRNALLPLLDEIHTNIQNMCSKELEFDDETPFSGRIIYPMEKLNEAVFGTNQYMFGYAKRFFSEYLDGIITIDDTYSVEQVWVLVLAGLYVKRL